jgi:hypothetical protein
MAKHDDATEDKKMIRKAFTQHDDQLHGGKKTKLSFKKGGPTSADRKKYGKNMSRAMNQKGASRGR